jgi:hypothetical protein
MFVVFNDGQFLAEDDGYSQHKQTSSHNTILVDGKGQKASCGEEWTQPLNGVDMAQLARIVSFKSTGDVVITEGEAGGMYDGLTRYRRAFVWVGGRYILILDDIRADHDAQLTWLVQGPQIETVDERMGAYRLRKGEARLDFRVAATWTSASVVDSTADDRGKSLGYKQLRLGRRASQWEVASVFDPWHRGVTLAYTPVVSSAGWSAATITVSGPGFADTWYWNAAPDKDTPSSLRCERGGQVVATLGLDDKAPTEGGPVAR